MIAALGFGWSIQNILIAAVIIMAGIALLYIAMRQFNVQIPEWVKQVFWVVVVCFVIVAAIRIVFSL